MTARLPDVAAKKKPAEKSAEESAEMSAEMSVEARAAVELVRLAREQGLSLTGPEGC
jgi:putative transposase